MTWTDEVGNLLKQYTSGGAAAAAQPAPRLDQLLVTRLTITAQSFARAFAVAPGIASRYPPSW